MSMTKLYRKKKDSDTQQIESIENKSKEPLSNEKEISENCGDSNEIDRESSLQASIEDLKNTIDQLTMSLKHVDAKFERQDKQLNYLYNRTKQLENSNTHLMNRVGILRKPKKNPEY